MIVWNKEVTENINEIRITMKKDKQERQDIMQDLQEKLIEKAETAIMDKMNEFIHQEEKYKERNMVLKIKTNFYSNNYRYYSRLDNNSITLIAIDILANMAKSNNIRHPRKIKGWKKSLSKQAIKEWYLKNKKILVVLSGLRIMKWKCEIASESHK